MGEISHDTPLSEEAPVEEEEPTIDAGVAPQEIPQMVD